MGSKLAMPYSMPDIANALKNLLLQDDLLKEFERTGFLEFFWILMNAKSETCEYIRFPQYSGRRSSESFL